jgi:hypothetical protein
MIEQFNVEIKPVHLFSFNMLSEIAHTVKAEQISLQSVCNELGFF